MLNAITKSFVFTENDFRPQAAQSGNKSQVIKKILELIIPKNNWEL